MNSDNSVYNILVVDDDKDIANLVDIHLSSRGYNVFTAYLPTTGLEIIESKRIDLCVIDVMMPEMNGLEMCRKIRVNHNMPIIMLSAKSQDDDKIIGLGTGADDYLAKPFNPLELIARVESQLRRYTSLNTGNPLEKDGKNVVLKNLTINYETREVTSFGEERKLTPLEFSIVYLLASHAGKVFTTDEIFENVWNEQTYEADNTVMVHIRRLREKLEAGHHDTPLIKTVWGVGYKVEADR
jgi:two-component system, OmpR family, response regulator VanR